MSTLDELKAAMRDWRTARKGGGSRGQALYDLNRWKGEQRKALDEEYNRRLADINAREESPSDGLSPEALDLVARAVREGASRSNIRVAIGKQSLLETDAVIEEALGRFQEKVATGTESAYALTATDTHARGWTIYDVHLFATGETHKGVYLTTPEGSSIKRAHLRITPAPPGSVDILDAIWDSGAAAHMKGGQ